MFETLLRSSQNAAEAGYGVALALICLVQYVYMVHCNHRARREREQLRQQAETLRSTLLSEQRDRALAQLEADLLHELVSRPHMEESLAALLRRFAPNPRGDFAAVIDLAEGLPCVRHSRGLSADSRRNLRIEPSLWEELRRCRLVELDGPRLHACELLGTLSREDRGKIRRLYLLAVGREEQLIGALLTTALFPQDAPEHRRAELALRLAANLGPVLQRSQIAAVQQHELRSTSDMLQLRAVIDRNYDQPSAMWAEFLETLRRLTGADRTALFLEPRPPLLADCSVVRASPALPSGVQARWNEFEQRLAGAVRGGTGVKIFDRAELQRRQIDTLIRRAVAVPLEPRGESVGTVCLTFSSAAELSEPKLRLVNWACDLLGQSIARAREQADVERQARLDGLTQLANRREFDRAIRRELERSRRSGSTCALLLLDLDHFKRVNDTYGHPAGDEALRAVAQVVRDQVLRIRAEDRALAARWGGEELAVLLPGMGLSGAVRLGEAIRRSIAGTTVPYREFSLRVTVSVGIALCPEHAESVDELLAAADAALYHAKQSGRNRVSVLREPVLLG